MVRTTGQESRMNKNSSHIRTMRIPGERECLRRYKYVPRAMIGAVTAIVIKIGISRARF